MRPQPSALLVKPSAASHSFFDALPEALRMLARRFRPLVLSASEHIHLTQLQTRAKALTIGTAHAFEHARLPQLGPATAPLLTLLPADPLQLHVHLSSLYVASPLPCVTNVAELWIDVGLHAQDDPDRYASLPSTRVTAAAPCPHFYVIPSFEYSAEIRKGDAAYPILQEGVGSSQTLLLSFVLRSHVFQQRVTTLATGGLPIRLSPDAASTELSTADVIVPLAVVAHTSEQLAQSAPLIDRRWTVSPNIGFLALRLSSSAPATDAAHALEISELGVEGETALDEASQPVEASEATEADEALKESSSKPGEPSAAVDDDDDDDEANVGWENFDWSYYAYASSGFETVMGARYDFRLGEMPELKARAPPRASQPDALARVGARLPPRAVAHR